MISAPVVEAVRSGEWLSPWRMRVYSLALLAASVAGLAYLILTANGVVDYQGRPLGTDFSNVYAAGTYAREGQASAAFDPPAQHAREKALFGPDTPFYGWHYPPFFLFIAAALAALPYGAALLVWQASTFLAYLATVRTTLGASLRMRDPDRTSVPLWLLVAAAFPAVFVNIGHGHNGFLSAALLGGGLIALPTRPWVAGVLFGLLAYKPQFGIVIPVVLLATGQWRAITAGALTVAGLALATTAAFGIEVWHAFAASTHFTREVVLEAGGTGWHKIQSVFSWARMWGAGVPLAYALQGATTLAIMLGLAAIWRSRANYALKAAALPLGALLATPYSLDYDLVVLAPTIAWLVRYGIERGFAPYERSTLALLWLMPLVARSTAEQALIPLGVLSMAGVLAVVAARAWSEHAGARDRGFAAQPAT